MVTKAVQKSVLAVHIATSVGWMGAVAAFIVLDMTTVTSNEGQLLRAAYIGMNLLTLGVIVPLAIGALLTGIAISTATTWGLFKHWWVVITLILTILATIVLVLQLPGIIYRAEVATNPATSLEELRGLGNLLLHSIGGTIVLLIITGLNVFKPRGLTRYGWRKQQKALTAQQRL